MKTVQTIYGVFDTDLGRLVGIAPQGVPDVTFLAGQDTQTNGLPVTATVNPVTGGSDFLSEVSTLKLTAGITDLTSGVGGAVSSGGMTITTPTLAGHMLLTPATADAPFRAHMEPSGPVVGTASKLDLMLDPYDDDSVNYRIFNTYVKTYDPADASTTQGNNGVAVVGSKATGNHWGVWPSMHFGFSDDGPASATPLKMYYFDTSDSTWRPSVDGAWKSGRAIVAGRHYLAGGILYVADSGGAAGATKPTHTSGSASDGSISYTFVRNFNTSSGSVRGTVVIGERDDLPKFGYPNAQLQLARESLVWSGKKINFANESGGTSAYIYSTTGLGSDEIRIEVASNKAIRLNATNKFFSLVGLRRVVGSATITSNTATPSVLDTEHLLLTNTVATNVTSFTDMLPNQIFSVEAGNSNTTLVHGSNLKLSGAVNKSLTVDDVLMFKVSASGTIAKQILG